MLHCILIELVAIVSMLPNFTFFVGNRASQQKVVLVTGAGDHEQFELVQKRLTELQRKGLVVKHKRRAPKHSAQVGLHEVWLTHLVSGCDSILQVSTATVTVLSLLMHEFVLCGLLQTVSNTSLLAMVS